ncbi:MAG: GspE/PulE family protein [Ignavibacteriales bacterium]|nr:GspE/PulE family protein [Ignavibacteriales bacterium]
MTTEYQQLIDVLLKEGRIDGEVLKGKRSQFDDAVGREGIAKSLVKILNVAETDVAGTIAKSFNLPQMHVAREMATAPTGIFAEEEIVGYRVLPIFQMGLELTVAFVDPPTPQIRVLLQKISGYRVLPVISTVSDFESALSKYSGALDKVQRVGSLFDLDKFDIRVGEGKIKGFSDDGKAEETMARLAEELLLRAAKMGASDIHIEPGKHELLIRFRVDGYLRRIVSLPMSYHPGILSILKAKSGMDMFEQLIPQDGRMSLKFADREIDVRVSSLPLLFGNKMVLRLLSTTAMMANLDNLGFSDANLSLFRSLLRLPNGIVLVTGPTGSGKTTTLYAGLNEIRSMDRNITTVENPVEYMLELVNQVQVNADRGLTFASILRAILRQDPNVILLGEIRDTETGTIATEAALTGHLVLSTLHTNDAVGAISRMINLGIESFWVSASVIGILGQRLVRKICARCKEEYVPDANTLDELGLALLPRGTPFFRGRGCTYCGGGGYKGRVAIHEVFVITEEMRDMIYGQVTTSKLRALAAANGFRDMYFDGVQKALAGITTLDEVRRISKKTI